MALVKDYDEYLEAKGIDKKGAVPLKDIEQ